MLRSSIYIYIIKWSFICETLLYGICKIFHKFQIPGIWSSQNILQNPDPFAKLEPKPLQNLDFANILQSPDINILHFGHFAKSS